MDTKPAISEAKRTCAIILAGGKGTRFHKQKQFVELEGKALWEHVYDKTIKVVDAQDVVVVGVDVEGGRTRSFSVRNGLGHFSQAYSRVVILEAARPLVTEEQIRQLVDSDSDSLTFVAPCVDTIIMRDKTFLNRADCLRLQTPQAFNFVKLKAAYDTGKYEDMTDETRVMFEEYGIRPSFIDGGDNLMKVTYPSDIFVLERYIKTD